MTINDLKRESVAFHEMFITSDEVPGDSFQKMPSLLNKLMEYVLLENPANDAPESDKDLVKHRSPVIPDDFRCPISLELMKDPVIVSTGHTYERSCIQKWIDIPGSTRDCVSSSSNRLVIYGLFGDSNGCKE
ncbi:U-box domain-containing protein 12-like [Humulus lupulus]|uniref:U-box domain-containing protein 12-like n=1 Tax=Humulus lupulus TaxID=3486 RepID=UPI002B402866|nr:U-box domain-containing protein 12-like [Humulus lupulus]